MRRLLPLLLLLPFLAAPGPGPGGHGLGGNPGNGNDGNVVFRFLPAGGAGAPTVMSDSFVPASELTGNWWELQGDGTVRTGSQALTATGSPVTTSLGVCPNGANCTAASAQLINQSGASTQFFATGNLATPTDVSCWALIRVDGTGTNWILGKGDSSGSGKVFDLYTSGGTFGFDVFSADATFTSNASPQYVPGAWHLLVGTYRFVADGTSVKVGYVDGVAFGSVSTAHGPLQAKSNTWQAGGWVPNPASRFPGAIRSAGCTEKALSAATITQMAAVTLGNTVTGTKGETLTFTRTSAKSCVANDGTVNMLPGGRPCITNGGYVAEKPYTNLILRSDAFDNAAWGTSSNAAAVPTITANSTDVVAPDGSNNAEKIVFPAVSTPGVAFSEVYQLVTRTAGAGSDALWYRTLSGTATVYLMQFNGGTYNTVACSVTATWTRCKLENQTLTAAGWYSIFGVDLRDVAQSAQGAQTVYAWGYQAQAGTFASSYIPTLGTAVATTGDALVWSTGFVDPGPTPSFSADVIPYETAGSYYWGALNGAAGEDWEFYNTVGGSTAIYATIGGVVKGPAASAAPVTGVSYHWAGNYDGTTLRLCKNAAGCGSSVVSFTPSAMTKLSIGTWNGLTTTYPGDVNVQNICIGKTPTACYP